MIYIITFLNFLVLSFLNAQTTENQCSNVDHRSMLPPIRHQGIDGPCYAFAAADLLSFETGENISPNALIAEYTLNKEKLDLEDPTQPALSKVFGYFGSLNPFKDPLDLKVNLNRGSTIYTALEASRAVGLCREKDMLSDGLITPKSHGEAEGKRSIRIANLAYDRIRSRTAGKNTPNPEEERCFLLDSDHHRFSGIDLKTFRSIVKKHYQNREDVILSLYKESCKNRMPFPKVTTEVKRWEPQDQKKFLPYINEILKNKPVGFLMYSSVFSNPHAPLSGAHALNIVGRKWNPVISRCEYLLRDSAGDDSSDFKINPVLIENGNIWLSEELLIKSIYGTTVLKNK